MSRDLIQHYHDVQEVRCRLEEHRWCRQMRGYDSKFIDWLNKKLMELENEAYCIQEAGK